MRHERHLSLGEEIANSLTHGAGFVASVVGLPVLVIPAAARGDAAQVVGCGVFAASLIALYSASTLYHALSPSRAKEIFRVLDHALIYVLIAGTYTPFTLGVLRGAWGWTLFGLVWSLAAVGIVLTTLRGSSPAVSATSSPCSGMRLPLPEASVMLLWFADSLYAAPLHAGAAPKEMMS
jgi:hemolysin III